MRGYVRAVMLRTVGWDDWVIYFSCICGIIYSGLTIGQTKWGLGLDLQYRPKVNLDQYSIINFVGRPFYMAGITGFKAALCISYLRILKQSNKNYRIVVWVVGISCVLSHIGGTLVLLFQCKPVEKSWHPAMAGKCLPNDITFYVLAAITIFYDIVIFFLPIPILLKLQINIRRKIGLLAIFMLGMFTTICSVMRLVQIITIAKTGNSTMLVLWGTIELNVGVLLTCIPALTPLFTYFRDKNSSRGYYNKNSQHAPTNSMPLQSRSNIGGGWKDALERDSDDNDSTKQIVRDGQTYANEPEGIRATVTVTVESEEAREAELRGVKEKWRVGH